ncbi:uncharacterized protein EDB91DRAFT_1090085 [Suillus paluster]|uniref:uncharacterized protein n=1 Tax=Suillus paluster TaxID=48578 RepID=UPI001B87629C|nr:uncharacterized protein EDB91DRAFT_1090085 [Suillus paluster]KAG1718383.1 hypothetical protein EDB91DRAFT_1090085 [Suillus paluster]
MVNTENNGIVLILRLQTGDVLDLQVHKHVQNNKQHQIDISFGSLQAAPARIQRIYHNVNFHAHHLASPTQCVSFIQFTVHYSMFLSLVLVFSLYFFMSLCVSSLLSVSLLVVVWVIWGLACGACHLGLHAVHATLHATFSQDFDAT